MFEFYNNMSLLGKLIFIFSLLVVFCSIASQCIICDYVPFRINYTDPNRYYSEQLGIPVEPESDFNYAPQSVQEGFDVQGTDQLSTDIHTIGHTPSILFFFAKWCPYCKEMIPEWEKFVENIKSMYKNYVKMYAVDGEKYPELVKKYGVNGYPSVLFVNKNKVAKFQESDRDAESLHNFLQKNIAQSNKNKNSKSNNSKKVSFNQ